MASIEYKKIQEININNLQPQSAYAQALQQKPRNHEEINYPKKDQGLIINSQDGIKIQEYIKSVIPLPILFASRLADERVCLYLSSKEIVKQISDNYETINGGGYDLGVRPLITHAKKYFLSKICPSIPQNIIEKEITAKLRIKVVSPIYMMRVGMDDPNYAHILSFRRYFFGVLEKGVELPDSQF